MGASVTTTIGRSGFGWSNILWEISDRAGDLTPGWPKVGDVIAQAMMYQFATAGAYGGKPWAPLKPEYLQWKVKHGFSPEILIQTGRMRRSLVFSPMSVEEFHSDHAFFGTDDPKARFHQYGTRFMPARPMLFTNPEMAREIAKAIADYIIHGTA